MLYRLRQLHNQFHKNVQFLTCQELKRSMAIRCIVGIFMMYFVLRLNLGVMKTSGGFSVMSNILLNAMECDFGISTKRSCAPLT